MATTKISRIAVLSVILASAGAILVFCIYSYLNWWGEGFMRFEESRVLEGEASIYARRGAIYDELGDYQEALANCNKAISLYQETVQPPQEVNDLNYLTALAYINRAEAYIGLGKYEPAISDSDKAIGLVHDKKAYYLRGEAYKKLGKHDLAMNDQEKAKELGYKPTAQATPRKALLQELRLLDPPL